MYRRDVLKSLSVLPLIGMIAPPTRKHLFDCFTTEYVSMVNGPSRYPTINVIDGFGYRFCVPLYKCQNVEQDAENTLISSYEYAKNKEDYLEDIFEYAASKRCIIYIYRNGRELFYGFYIGDKYSIEDYKIGLTDNKYKDTISRVIQNNVLVYDADAPIGIFTPRLISLVNILMARNCNSENLNFFLSEKAYTDYARKTFGPYETSKNIYCTSYLGIGNKIQNHFESLGGTMPNKDVEIAIAIDNNNFPVVMSF